MAGQSTSIRRNGKISYPRRAQKVSTLDYAYISGSAVPKEYELIRSTPRRANHSSRRTKTSAVYTGNAAATASSGFSFGFCFLIAAVAVTAYFCYRYVKLRSEITQIQKHISKLESSYNDLKLSNDEEYDRIMGSVDLEEIKRIAMSELGMKYPDGDQVVHISGADDDYVRQYDKIPEK